MPPDPASGILLTLGHRGVALGAALLSRSLPAVLGEIARATGAQAANLTVVDEGSRSLLLIASWGYPEELTDTWQRFPLDADLPLCDAARRGVAVFVPDQQALLERYPMLERRPTIGSPALAAIPVFHDGDEKVVAAVGLSFATAQSFGARQREHLIATPQRVRSRLGSLRRQDLPEETTHGGTLLLALNAAGELAWAMRAGQGMPEFAETVARAAQRLVGSDAAAVWKVEGDRAALVGRSAAPAAGRAAGSLERDLMRELGIPATVHVPLTLPGRTRGELTCTWHALPAPPRSVLPVLKRFAEMAGLAMKAAEDQRPTAAREAFVQAARVWLRPCAPPHPEGVQVGGAFLAKSGEFGGDFCTLIPLGSGVWGLALGDVSGSGARAAAQAVRAVHVIRGAARGDPRPAHVLQALNDEFAGGPDADPERFCTAVFARLQPTPQGLVVDLARGGHPSPLVIRADGTSNEAAPEGQALGLLPSVEIAEERVVLHGADTLFCYTDGLTERRDEGREFGPEALRAILERSTGIPVQETVDAAVQAALAHGQDAPLTDDLALIGIRGEAGAA